MMGQAGQEVRKVFFKELTPVQKVNVVTYGAAQNDAPGKKRLVGAKVKVNGGKFKYIPDVRSTFEAHEQTLDMLDKLGVKDFSIVVYPVYAEA